jgi:hypothetical protein
MISYFGYLTFGNAIANNIILNCMFCFKFPPSQIDILVPDNVPTFICLIAVSILVLFSYPLQIHPCRISITNLMRALLPERYFKKIPENALHFGISFALWVTTFLIAYFVGGNLTIVCSFTFLLFLLVAFLVRSSLGVSDRGSHWFYNTVLHSAWCILREIEVGRAMDGQESVCRSTRYFRCDGDV